MQIERIDRLHECGVFRDFRWAAVPDLQEFGQFNLIYGWNGSGKTTLSRILRNLELRTVPQGGDIALRVSGRRIQGSRFGEVPAETVALKVFNQDFVKDNVFRPDDDGMTPIVVLGKRSIEAQQKIDQLKAELETLNQELAASERKERDFRRDLDNHVQTNARTLKDLLGNQPKSAYRNYNRGHYETRADTISAAGDVESLRLSDEERIAFVQRQAETQRDTVSLPEFDPVDLAELEAEASGLLAKTVTSTALDSLVRDPALAAWILDGLQIHAERSPEDCLYCSRPMPPERLETLRDHFDGAHGELMRDLESALSKCEAGARSIEAFRSDLPVAEQFYADLSAPFEEAKARLSAEADHALSFLKRLAGDLGAKKERAFESMSLGYKAPSNGRDSFASVTRIVEKHNESCAEFEASVARARGSIESDFIAERLDAYKSLKFGLTRTQLTQERVNRRAQEIRDDIAQLGSDILDHRPPADDLNADLRDYLGPGAMHLAVNEHGYTLTRDGRPAKDPSEGEMTAIALLYFLRTLNSRGFDLKQGIVVLDDPVSSLDENALFTAASYIRRRTQGAGQLIILTHNFAFFREIRNWLRNVKGQRKKDPAKRPARFYMLRCIVIDGKRAALLRPLDPLLAQYESDYHYLFSRIYRAANTPTNDLEDNYVLPNMARRLIEAFLAFKHPQSDNLWDKVSRLSFDEVKKTQVLRFLNVYSHNETIGAPQLDPTLLAESDAALRNLLELIHSVDSEHYDAMVALVTGTADEDDE